jgi:adenosylmethionine-8-amino-7-oxononanoate aminotransferase
MSAVRPLDLDAFWMPFTANRQFKANPRLLARAEGLYYWTPDERQVLDAAAGLWCVNAGHGRKEITDAVARQIAVMDYAPPFQMGHPIAFELASSLVEISPKGLDRVFFTNSGSESVDTALKIAIAYHRIRGEGARSRLIGRERGYHGVGFGGISVGGMVNNRKFFGMMLPGVDHLRHTHDPARNLFSKGLPEHGAEFADDLERLVALHDASTIAAVIVEPIAGSTGVFMQGPPGAIELFHGYTYSAHPIACAAGLAAQKIYRGEGLFERAKAMAPYWSDAVHSLKGRRNVVDLRAYGMVAGIELAPRDGAPGARGYDALVAAFNAGLLIRTTGDTIAMSPPLIIERKEVDRIFETLAGIIDRLD